MPRANVEKLCETGSNDAEVLQELDTIFWDEYTRSERLQLTSHESDLQSPLLLRISAAADSGGAPLRHPPHSGGRSLWWRDVRRVKNWRFWSDARDTLYWICFTFFDSHPSPEEQAFRLFYLQQRMDTMFSS